MALSTGEQDRLSQLIKQRKLIRERQRKAEADLLDNSDEIKAIMHRAGVTRFRDGDELLQLGTVVDFRSFDADGKASAEFPIDEHPELYVLDYKRTKQFLNARANRDEGDTKLIAPYAGFIERLTLRTVTKKRKRTRPIQTDPKGLTL